MLLWATIAAVLHGFRILSCKVASERRSLAKKHIALLTIWSTKTTHFPKLACFVHSLPSLYLPVSSCRFRTLAVASNLRANCIGPLSFFVFTTCQVRVVCIRALLLDHLLLATSTAQWALPDLNRKCQIAVGTTGPPRQAPDGSGHSLK